MRNIRAHTGLRGVAALAVFLGHAQFNLLWPQVVWIGGIYSFFMWQNPAVDLFFILSGFVLNYAYLKHRRTDWRSYLVARFARICPLYYAGFLAVLAMNLVSARLGHVPSSDFKPSILIPNLLMVQEWPVPARVTSIDFPSWSISVEVFLYLAAFPFFAWLYSRHKVPRGVSCAVLAAAAAANSLFGSVHFSYGGLARGISGFAAGFLLCELINGREKPLVPRAVEIAFGLCAVAILPFVSLHFLLPFLFVVLLAVTYSPSSALGWLLGTAFIEYLGEISYSIYIWHFPVIKACTLLFGLRHMGDIDSNLNISPGQKLLYLGGTILALALVANVSYYWYETPLRQFFRRSGRGQLARRPIPHASES
jgi:peptidoglycan/LPS O-acetylase OafA/YrhL